jgi:tight adherence protein B
MLLIVTVVFIGVFVVVAVLMVGAGVGASDDTKKTLAVLNSALATTSVFGTRSDDETIDIRRHELLSTIPWLNRWLVQLDLAPRLRALLYQANLKWTVGALLLSCLASGVIVGYAVLYRTGVLELGLLFFTAGLGLPIFYVFWQRSRRFGQFEQNLPNALDLIVGALRAGHSLISAIGIVGREAADPIDKEFRICFDEQNFGVDFRTAMLNLATRVPIQDVRIVVTAVLIQRESGGNLAEVLEKVASIIRDRFRLKKQIQVHTAQGRLTGAILAVLPVVLGFALYMVNPKHMSVLWEKPVGVQMMWGSGIMTTIGALLIRKIIRIRV